MGVGETGREKVDQSYVAHHRDQWWVRMNTVINLRVPWKVGNFLIS
jgi:hypothetical protein